MIKSEIVNEVVEEYVRNLIPKRNEFLEDLKEYANNNNVPILHPEVATLLEVLIRTSNSKSILEIGTAIGYSTLIMANSISKTGKITTIEINEKMYNIAKKNLLNKKNNVDIDIKLGDAKEVLESLDEEYDFIFIDAAKGHYKLFFDLCFEKLKKGGIIVSDNVLYKGMIASDDYVVRRKKTIVKRMRNYLEYISSHSKLKTTIMPFADGVAISYKMEE